MMLSILIKFEHTEFQKYAFLLLRSGLPDIVIGHCLTHHGWMHDQTKSNFQVQKTALLSYRLTLRVLQIYNNMTYQIQYCSLSKIRKLEMEIWERQSVKFHGMGWTENNHKTRHADAAKESSSVWHAVTRAAHVRIPHTLDSLCCACGSQSTRGRARNSLCVHT